MSTVEPPNGKPPKMHWTFGSIALFAIGLLIAIPSGLCTVGLGLPMMFYDSGTFGTVIAVGGIPLAIGVGLVYAGLKSRRRD